MLRGSRFAVCGMYRELRVPRVPFEQPVMSAPDLEIPRAERTSQSQEKARGINKMREKTLQKPRGAVVGLRRGGRRRQRRHDKDKQAAGNMAGDARWRFSSPFPSTTAQSVESRKRNIVRACPAMAPQPTQQLWRRLGRQRERNRNNFPPREQRAKRSMSADEMPKCSHHSRGQRTIAITRQQSRKVGRGCPLPRPLNRHGKDGALRSSISHRTGARERI